MVDLIKRYKWWLFGIIFLGGLLALREQWRHTRENSRDAVILEAAARSRVHPALIKAVVWRESWFNAQATGKSGEVGLMQIMKDTASDWAAAERLQGFQHDDLYDPAKNTRCGAWYLRRLLARYAHTDSPTTYALAAYNAGPGNVARWNTGAAATNSVAFLQHITYPGTRDYVVAVTKRYERYRRNFPPKNGKPEG